MAAPCKHASLPTPSVQVVFVLDDLERFTKQRGRQTLLYNMLDELQHSNVQVGSSLILKVALGPQYSFFVAMNNQQTLALLKSVLDELCVRVGFKCCRRLAGSWCRLTPRSQVHSLVCAPLLPLPASHAPRPTPPCLASPTLHPPPPPPLHPRLPSSASRACKT